MLEHARAHTQTRERVKRSSGEYHFFSFRGQPMVSYIIYFEWAGNSDVGCILTADSEGSTSREAFIFYYCLFSFPNSPVLFFCRYEHIDANFRRVVDDNIFFS